MDKFRTECFLPLSEVAFEVLLSLAEGERHGYRILQDVQVRTGDRLRLHAGSLYRVLARLLDQELIEELERPADQDPRRRSYGLTSKGRAVAQAEAARLEQQVATARARRLLTGTTGAFAPQGPVA